MTTLHNMMRSSPSLKVPPLSCCALTRMEWTMAGGRGHIKGKWACSHPWWWRYRRMWYVLAVCGVVMAMVLSWQWCCRVSLIWTLHSLWTPWSIPLLLIPPHRSLPTTLPLPYPPSVSTWGQGRRPFLTNSKTKSGHQSTPAAVTP